MNLSVIVPCYNEVQSLIEFHDQISDVLKRNKIDYELIMVDDGSSDGTMETLKNLNKKDKRVKIISFSKNFGKESAMFAGLKNASGSYVAIMDADMQHSPSTLIEMYNKLINTPEYDVVCAYRENRNEEQSLKKVLTALFYKIINRISDVRLLPGAGDFRVFKKCVRDAIISLPEKTRFLKGIFSWVGFNTIYVPYTPEKRKFGNSKWSIIKLIKYSLGGIVSFSTLPVKSVFVIGILAFIVGFLNFILLGNLSHRTIIFLLSLVLLLLGIISLYVSRIYSNILNRPSYIIREQIGFNNKK